MKPRGPEIHWEKILENLPIKVLAVAVALMLFIFHRIESIVQKEYTLPVELVLDPGYVPLENPVQRAKVLIRGPRTSLESLQADNLKVVADVSAYRSEGKVRIPLGVLRSGLAAELPSVEILVEPLDLMLDLEKKTSRIVEVQPQFTGSPAPDFEVEGILYQPTKVTLLGPRSIIAGVSQAVTEKVDILGVSSDLVKDVRLIPPHPSVTFLGGDTVNLRVTVKALESIFEVPPQIPLVQGLSPGLRLVRPPQPVGLRIRGPKVLLVNTQTPGAEVVLDLKGIQEPGLYELPVTVTVPEGFVVQDMDPERQILSVEER